MKHQKEQQEKQKIQELAYEMEQKRLQQKKKELYEIINKVDRKLN